MSGSLSNNTNSFNTNTTVNVSNYTVANDDKSKILSWLSPIDPLARHLEIQTQRVDGVGDWLLQTKEFTSWYNGCGNGESDRSVLFCYGDPGVGKSYITSLVVETLFKRRRRQNIVVTGFYFDFATREEQSPRNVLGSLLKQLVGGLKTFPEEIMQEFHDQKKNLGGGGLRPPEIVHLFQSISSTQRTFICIDAIDECEPAHRLEVLGSLCRLLQTSPNTRIFMTGRSHVRAEIERPLGFTTASVSIRPTQDDIVTYLQARLGKDTAPEVMNSRLKAEILKNIPEANPEIFLLVSLHIEAILRETTISRRRGILKEMADSLRLEDAYHATLERIKAQGKEKEKLAMTTLMWICHSERPLEADELCHALAVEIGSTDFDPDNVPLINTLLSCCQGLIAVDRKASSVRLVHSTLREYLFTSPDRFPSAHSTMAETCLTYLNSRQVKDLSLEPIPNPQSMPFLKYSSRYWGTHAKKELSDSGKRLALELLGQYESHITAELLSQQVVHHNYSSVVNTPLLSTALHCACFFGIPEIATALIGLKCYDINRRDGAGATPLSWAARGGHGGVVELLLGREDVIPDMPDNRGRTPFSRAAMWGHEGVVKQLLGRKDVILDSSDDGGRTPFSYAAGWGNEKVVKLLLGWEGVNPDRLDNEGGSPLTYAAARGHEGVVKLLLGRDDVFPDRPDNRGATPLSYATRRGHEEVVKLLLGWEGVNPDRPDNEGGSPFAYAAARGHEGVVKLLLGRDDVFPDRPDNRGATPLSYATRRGHEEVVKLLLGRKDVNPNTPDNEGRTPLSFAAGRGYEGMVKLLLEREDVIPDRPDNKGTTPFSLAAGWGYEGAVRLLLEREDVAPDEPNDEGASPLSYAAGRGHEGIVNLLLGREDVLPDRPDSNGRTPFSHAARWGHEGIVELLLGRKDVNPGKPDVVGRTPFSYAAARGHEGVVKLLLGREDIHPDMPDGKGRTPLSYAASWGYEGVVKLLLGSEYVIPAIPDNLGRTPLSYATMNGYAGIAQLLQIQNPTTGNTV